MAGEGRETWGDVFGRMRAKGMDAADAAFRADEWQRRQQGKPETRFLHAAPMTNSTFAEHLMAVGSFIAFHDPKHMMGGHRAEEAFSALCALLGLDPAGLRAALSAPADRPETEGR